MFADFIKKISLRLINDEFNFIGVSGDGENISSETNVILMAKAVGGIMYVVGIADGSKIDLESYKIEMDNILHNINKNLHDFLCTRLVCVNIISGNENAKEFVDKQEYFTDELLTKVWWYIDIENKNIMIPKGQPDKLISLDRFILEAFEDESNFDSQPIEFRKFESVVMQHTALKHRTSNSSLTMALVAINIIIFVYGTISGNADNLVDKFALNASAVFNQKEFYRLFTAMFLHLDLTHILSNSLYLYLFGSRVEKYYGKLNFVYIYVISGLMGSIFSFILTRGISAGASGAIYGLLGATLALSQVRKKSIDGLSLYTIMIIFFPGLVLGLFSPYIDIWGHVGGAIGGYFTGLIINKLILKTEDIK